MLTLGRAIDDVGLALLFHTVVLKLLAERSNTLPIRIFLSLLLRGAGYRNRPDITNFPMNLPDDLPEYLVILTVTDAELADSDTLSEKYQIREF